MNLFQKIKDSVEESTILKSPQTLEDTYEFFYHIISRLRDMDDFTQSMLLDLQKQLSLGKNFAGSLKDIINSQYEFADSDYFKDSIDYLKDDLLDIFNRVIESSHMQEDWSTEINYLADHKTINYLGEEYTLEQLRNLIEGGSN